MRLFKYEGHRVVISPEALILKPFKRYGRGISPKIKIRHSQNWLSSTFYCDPRSEYMIIIDEETRMEEIKKGEGLRESWTLTKL